MDAAHIGNLMAKNFRLQLTTTLVAKVNAQSNVSIARLQGAVPDDSCSDPMPSEDAYLLALHLREIHLPELWVDGRAQPSMTLQPGSIALVSLIDPPRARRGGEVYDAVHFHIKRSALQDLAGERDRKRIQLRSSFGNKDAVITNLSNALMPALTGTAQLPALFIDHVVMALLSHLIVNYSAPEGPAAPRKGMLAPWQLRRAKELMEARLTSDISLAELAAECRVSRSHFTRAFKECTGMPPYQYLLERRIDRAKQLLSSSDLSLAEIAVHSGFAEQSYFTRMFSSKVGTSPGAWQRCYREA